MNKTKINEIKNRVYEAEGLLELLTTRPEIAETILPLVAKRLDEAQSLLKQLPAEPDQEPPSTPEPASIPEPEPASTPEPAPTPTSDPEPEPTPLYVAEPETEPEPIPEHEPVSEPISDSLFPSSFTPPAFCLNDRFRFRRSIFGGSDAEFNAAMRHIATLPDYEDALRYLGEEMGIDLEDEDVVDFLEILKPCWS
ncbi:MAG: hypothetical protein ACI304_04415 [Lepagella sp.]